MKKELQNRLKHFIVLKSKYQASKYEDSSPSSLLYLILRKADLGIELTELEFDWLREHELVETVEAIQQDQQRRVEELRKLEKEFSSLKIQYKVPNLGQGFKDDISVPLYPILWKLNSENKLNKSEVEWLKINQLVKTLEIVHEMELKQHFVALKVKYQATQHQDSSPRNPLYAILKKLETKTLLSDSELKWLIDKKLFETRDIFEQQKAEKQADFIKLKVKYQAIKYSDVSISSPLYPILQKLDADKKLVYSEIYWLEEQELVETIAIANQLEQKREFALLKAKYKANEYEDDSPSSHLYRLLKKLDSENYLSEQDSNFLRKRKLTETIAIANQKYASSLKSKVELGKLLDESEIDWLKNHQREDIISLAQKKHFARLKKKYRLVEPELPFEPYYTIMIKLERKERLDPLFVIQLIEQELLSNYGEIAIAHYRLEADFYEQEFKRTGHKWHIPTASSYWRKANEPKRALQITNLDLGKVKESNLKSAILVTRGAAYRDIDDLVNAEKCAKKAIEYHSKSYQPYTLMGAIYYDKGEYPKGDEYFAEAIKRGAKTEEIDDEIKRVVRSTKDENKRQDAVKYLLKKDSQRYAWAKSYLKKSKNKGEI